MKIRSCELIKKSSVLNMNHITSFKRFWKFWKIHVWRRNKERWFVFWI